MILKNNLQKSKLFRLVVLFFGKLQFFQKFILGLHLRQRWERHPFSLALGMLWKEKDIADSVLKRHKIQKKDAQKRLLFIFY